MNQVHPTRARSPIDAASNANTPLLHVEDLSVRFLARNRTVRAVDGVSFDVLAGETVALVGESGCGKSTTALAILRLLRPEHCEVSGAVQFEGRDLLTAPASEMDKLRGDRIAMVFQEPMSALNPVLTIGRQVAEPLELHMGLKRSEARGRALELLRLVRIADAERRLDDYPHQLSGGMRQRVMIAMALACQPRLIVADEPTTALDVTVQEQILDLLRDLSTEFGIGVILITHNLGLVARYADRVEVMYAGRIVESAPTRELFRDPRHPYTAALLRSVPRVSADAAELVPIEGAPPNLGSPPSGCAFHPRCPLAFARCVNETPLLLSTSGDAHRSRCWAVAATREDDVHVP